MLLQNRFDVFVPDIPGAEAVEDFLGIDPDEAARIGHHFLYNPGDSYRKETRQGREYGFTVEMPSRGIFIRALYPAADLTHIPTDKKALQAHMQWHASELDLMQDAGAKVPANYPILVRDKALWGNGYGILTIAEHISIPDSEKLSMARRELISAEAASIALTYLTSPNHVDPNQVIYDLAREHQFAAEEATGDPTVLYLDLDPYATDNIAEELREVRLWLGRLPASPRIHKLALRAFAAETNAIIDQSIQNTNI